VRNRGVWGPRCLYLYLNRENDDLLSKLKNASLDRKKASLDYQENCLKFKQQIFKLSKEISPQFPPFYLMSN
jgi:hypothetical protein